MSKEAIQYINSTLAAFGPDEAISMTKETWSKLREAMQALAEQPAQRKPLTDEQIQSVAFEAVRDNWDWLRFARAIEAAHGIKEKNQ